MNLPLQGVAISPTIAFWVISAFLFLWGAAYAGLTVFSFVLAKPEHWQNLAEQGQIRQEYADYIAAIPGWVIGLTFVAALTRFLGGSALLLQKSWAVPAYSLSLVCVVVLMFRGFVFADVASVIRTSQVWLEAAFLGLSFFAVWWARYQTADGVLR